MFVMNCRISKDEVLKHFSKPSKKERQKSKWKGKKKGSRGGADEGGGEGEGGGGGGREEEGEGRDITQCTVQSATQRLPCMTGTTCSTFTMY